jgi:hypothetical protein
MIATMMSSFTLITVCHSVKASISYGELVDKITILTIKAERISDEKKLQNIMIELNHLQELFDTHIGNNPKVIALMTELKATNQRLWDVEDAIRSKERLKEFDADFIALSRKIYTTNDHRCALKKEIDGLFNSTITEEKSYEEYRV